VLILERGDYVPRERENWDTHAVNKLGRYNTKETWRDADGKPLHPHTNYWVGGNTKFYGAALFRLRREDFAELRHHGGVSPAWPISYDELEPYYTEAASRTTSWSRTTPKPSTCTRCAASAASTPRSRRRARRTAFPR
jgi:choline dehydrogenase-like flavoprotein